MLWAPERGTPAWAPLAEGLLVLLEAPHVPGESQAPPWGDTEDPKEPQPSSFCHSSVPEEFGSSGLSIIHRVLRGEVIKAVGVHKRGDPVCHAPRA